MALIKRIETKHGVTAEYWKIDHVEIQYDTKAVYVKANLYTNKAARELNKSPLSDEAFEAWLGVDIHQAENTRELLYQELKKEEFFDGATDD